MYIGSTPTHIFTIPFSTDLIKCVRILYAQKDKLILVKNTENCTLNDNTIQVKLSQKETFLFNCTDEVKIQVRILTKDNESFVSPITYINGKECLEREEIV